MSFQTCQTFVHLLDTNEDLFDEIWEFFVCTRENFISHEHPRWAYPRGAGWQCAREKPNSSKLSSAVWQRATSQQTGLGCGGFENTERNQRPFNVSCLTAHIIQNHRRSQKGLTKENTGIFAFSDSFSFAELSHRLASFYIHEHKGLISTFFAYFFFFGYVDLSFFPPPFSRDVKLQRLATCFLLGALNVNNFQVFWSQ